MLTCLYALAALAAPRATSLVDEPAPGLDTGFEAERPELPECDDAYPFRLVQLPARPGLYTRWDKTRSWGTAALVDAIVEVGARMAVDHPEADPIFVGDLSTSRGGPLPPHRSHGDGRSADVGLYRKGGLQPVSGFEPLSTADFDAELTWAAIESFLATGQVHHILLDQDLIDELRSWLLDSEILTLDEIDRIFPAEVPSRGEARFGIVRPAPNHRDHFHVRFRCE